MIPVPVIPVPVVPVAPGRMTPRSAFTVRVPATTANLGPGFDALGLALDLHDEHRFTPMPRGAPPVSVMVSGEGVGSVACDDANLVVTAARAAAADVGAVLPPFALSCDNSIPHGLGLGSSAAAIVAGVVGGRTLAGVPRDPGAELTLAARLEGHPDNVAPAVLGGFTVAWCEPGLASAATARAARLDAVGIAVIAFLPSAPMSTVAARGLLPALVPHADAAHSAGRAALVVAALTGRPDLLLPATEDRLHTRARGIAMPASLDLLDRLRASGVAAVLSGAGPTVLALVDAAAPLPVLSPGAATLPAGWRRVDLLPDPSGVTVAPD